MSRIVKSTAMLLMAGMLLFMTVGSALAVSYYDVGSADLVQGSSAIHRYYTSGTTPTIEFGNNRVTGPDGDIISANSYQTLVGTYTIGTQVESGVYQLTRIGTTPGQLYLSTAEAGGDHITLYALSNALLINFADHTVSWSVTSPTYPNTVNSAVLDNFKAVTDAGGSLQFTTFLFEASGTESTWLAGTANPSYSEYAKYYSRMEGIAAAPEPAEWMLMFIGLCMLGFYLKHYGYLDFDISHQSEDKEEILLQPEEPPMMFSATGI